MIGLCLNFGSTKLIGSGFNKVLFTGSLESHLSVLISKFDS